MSAELIVPALLAMACVVVAAFLAGRLALMVGQPSVVGEMVAGVALGPTLLGRVAPQASTYLFGQDQRDLLAVLGATGLALYMFHVGVQHRVAPTHQGGTALALRVAAVGVLLPLTVGALTAATLLSPFRPAGVSPWVYWLFVAGAMTVTAFPMLGRMLEESRMSSTRLGVVATRAAAVDDVVAWTILAVVTAAAAGTVSDVVTRTVLPVLVFVLACWVLAPRMFGKMVKHTSADQGLSTGACTAVVTAVLLAAAITEWAGVYAVFGGFVLGMCFPATVDFAAALDRSVMPLVRVVLLPMFFALSGLATDLGLIRTADAIWAMVVVLTVAFVTKLSAPWFALLGTSWPARQSLALGALLNARGLMILIYNNVGYALGIIDSRIFAMLTLVAILSTALARPAYTWALGTDTGSSLQEPADDLRSPAVAPRT